MHSNFPGMLNLISNEIKPDRLMINIFSLVIAIASVFLFNFFLARNETLSKPAFFAPFIFVLFVLEFIRFFNFHPGLMSNFFIILGTHRIFSSYRQEMAKGPVFDGAFFFSLGALIYAPALVLLPLVLFSLIVLRPFVWREWVFAVAGMVIPPLVLLSIFYLSGDYSSLQDKFLSQISVHGLFFKPNGISQYFYLFIILTVLFVIVFQRLTKGYQSKKIRQQKNITIFVAWLALSACSLFFENHQQSSIPILSIPPLSAIIGEWMGNFKKDLKSDFLLLTFFAATVLVVLNL